jgi:hypothetical protein
MSPVAAAIARYPIRRGLIVILATWLRPPRSVHDSYLTQLPRGSPVGRDLHQDDPFRCSPASFPIPEPGAAQAPDDLGNAHPPAKAFGHAAERQHDMPPAPPALDMKLPLLHVPDGCRRDRVGIEGRLRHGSPAVSSRASAHDIQTGAVQLLDQILRAQAAEKQGSRPWQSAGTRDRGTQCLDHLFIRNQGSRLGKQVALNPG